jgi:hypothetical protein
MSSVRPKASYRRVKRKALLYDLDLLNQRTLFRVDLIVESVDSVITPVVPLYEARFTEDNPNALPARGFDPRNLSACFVSPERKEIRRTVYNPYRPTTPEHRELTKQLYQSPNVATLTYKGESHERNYERFV